MTCLSPPRLVPQRGRRRRGSSSRSATGARCETAPAGLDIRGRGVFRRVKSQKRRRRKWGGLRTVDDLGTLDAAIWPELDLDELSLKSAFEKGRRKASETVKRGGRSYEGLGWGLQSGTSCHCGRSWRCQRSQELGWPPKFGPGLDSLTPRVT